MTDQPSEGRAATAQASLPTQFVYPGQVLASATPHEFTTILGTCVAVCLFDATAAVGGLNHYLLPYGAGALASGTRYGNVAMEQLLKGVLALGAQRERLCAKVFGGMVPARPAPNQIDLGSSNVTFALDWLAQQSIPVLTRDVGGTHGRKLLFHPQNGNAWIRHF